MASKDKLGDLNVTGEELERISKALKDEEFRKLFVEYAEEISNPENRKRYEEEIALLEKEKGVDVQFVHPDPGYVLKTSVDGSNKAFINICKNDLIAKPSSEKQVTKDGRRGLAWKIPHSFAPVRDDVDKNGGQCKVFDFVVHPDTYRMAETSERFKEMLHDTVSEGIQQQFSMQMDRKNVKVLKMKFKGTPTPTVIRNKNEDGKPVAGQDPHDILSKLQYPYGEVGSQDKEEGKDKIEAQQLKNPARKDGDLASTPADFTTPKYSVKHRSDMDMKDFCNGIASSSTRPKELVIDVELPLLKSARPVSLDIFEKRLVLQSTEKARYKLDIALPYPVDENEGSAKFDKAKRKLVITLPVIQSSDVKPPVVNGSGSEVQSKESDQQQADELIRETKQFVEKPLIEVMGSSQESPEYTTSEDDGTSSELPKTNPDVPLSMPEFSYNQTDETLTILLQVNKASPKSVKKAYGPDEKTVLLKAMSVGDGGFPIHYQLCLGLPDDLSVNLDASHQDVSPENVVFVLTKSEQCQGSWDRIMVGSSPSDLKEKLLLTERTIIQQLDALDQQHANMPVAKDTTLDLEVTEMNSDKLTVEIKDGSGRSRRKKRLSESAEDIEVVHDKQTPKLHSILKQRSRTLSESSDDLFTATEVDRQNSSASFTSSEGIITESDDSPDCPTGRKKSVSFSEQVDQTTFKTNTTVSSMHSTLKNKRRRQRKREQKQERQHNRRVRRTSAGSEPSSDEHATLDDDDEDGVIVLPAAEAAGTTPPASDKNTTVSDSAKKAQPSDEPKLNPKAKETDCDPSPEQRTNGSENPTVETLIQNLDIADTNGHELANGDKTNKVDNGVTPCTGDQNGNAQVEDRSLEEPERTNLEAGDAKSKPGLVKEDNNQTSSDVPADEADTMLSWKEGESSSEHKTQCAIQLSNDIIFDLDTD